jgi:hypothetical protein
MSINFVLLVFAFVFFVIAALPYQPTSPYWNRLVAAGLAFWVGSLIFFR